MPKSAFELKLPDHRTSCAIFASPHSSRDYPMSFLDRTLLTDHSVRSSEDAFVDQLFDCATEFGAPLLLAGAPRAFLDLNRGPEELDPALIDGVRRQGHNPRVASGLGVIPRVVSNGRAIYRGKISAAEARQRIDSYWHPYHAELQRQLTETRSSFGRAVLIDCHSMPHEAVRQANMSRRPEIVLGDRFGASAHPEVVDHVEAAFAAAGLVVTRNTPFAGAYVTQTYGRPSRHVHAVQIEIDRALYMDEQTICPNAHFEEFRRLLRGVIADIAGIPAPDQALAAE